MEKKALGKGIGALFEGAAPETMAAATGDYAPNAVIEIDLDAIVPNRFQPRRDFDDRGIDELAASLKANGLLQPVIVRANRDGGYELIAGERRWRAAQRAGLRRLPAIVRAATEQQLAVWALIENLQRQDLNAIEAARAYRRLADEFHLTQDEIARQVGKDRSTITNILRLLNLPEEVQALVITGQLDLGHAKALLSLNEARTQLQTARVVATRQLSVRATEALVRRLQQPRPRRGAVVADTAALQERLRRRLGARVQLVAARKGGRIVIHYFDATDLERLLELLQS